MFPTEIRANFDFSILLEDKASDVGVGYTPKLNIGGAASLTKNGTISSTDILFTFLAADTTALATGHYWYQVVAENGSGGRTFIQEGSVYVQGTISGTGTYDGRSVAEKIVEAIDATIQGKATKDQQSYMIQSGSGSRSLSRLSMRELTDARTYYAGIVASEKRDETGAPLFKRHKFGFERP